MCINNKLQQMILSRLEDGASLADITKEECFVKELNSLVEDGKVEDNGKPNPSQNFYDNHRITSYGRKFLE